MLLGKKAYGNRENIRNVLSCSVVHEWLLYQYMPEIQYVPNY